MIKCTVVERCVPPIVAELGHAVVGCRGAETVD